MSIRMRFLWPRTPFESPDYKVDNVYELYAIENINTSKKKKNGLAKHGAQILIKQPTFRSIQQVTTEILIACFYSVKNVKNCPKYSTTKTDFTHLNRCICHRELSFVGPSAVSLYIIFVCFVFSFLLSCNSSVSSRCNLFSSVTDRAKIELFECKNEWKWIQQKREETNEKKNK